MAVPLAIVGEVVRRLEQHTVRVVVCHPVCCHDVRRTEGIPLAVGIIHTVCCGEGQPFDNIEFNVNMCPYHTFYAVVLVGLQQSEWVFLDAVVGVLVVLPLIIHHLHSGRIVESRPQRVVLRLVETCTLAVALREVHIGRKVEPAEDAGMNIRLGRIPFELGIGDDTLMLHIVARDVELRVFITLRERQLIVLRDTGAQEFVSPVDARIGPVEIVGQYGGVNALVAHKSLRIFLRSHHFGNIIGV